MLLHLKMRHNGINEFMEQKYSTDKNKLENRGYTFNILIAKLRANSRISKFFKNFSWINSFKSCQVKGNVAFN